MAHPTILTKTRKPRKAAERNIALFGQWTHYLLAHPEIFERLPDKFELVILPDDDDELRRYNLQLLTQYESEGQPIVFLRLKSSHSTDFEALHPSIYVPLPLAA